MKKYNFIFSCFFLLLLSNCNLTGERDAHFILKQKLQETELQLVEAQKDLLLLKSTPSYPLVHIVYFKLKEEANPDELINAIQKLEAIEVLKNLEVGTFKDLGDKRALADFDITMQMEFEDEAAYQKYQQHALHLALKEEAGKYLAGPPVTYDFWKE